MAHSTTIGGYRIEVHALRSADTEVLTRIGGKDDLLTFLNDALETLRTHPYADQERDSQIRSTKVERIGLRSIFAELQVGEFGVVAEGRRLRGDEKVYDRTKDIVELMPLYVLLHVPRKSHSGVLIVHRFGNRSAFTPLARFLTERFGNRHDEYRLGFSRYIPPSLLDALADGIVRGLTLRLQAVPHDLATIVGRFGNPKEIKHVSISMTPARNSAFHLSKPLKDVLADPKKIAGITMAEVLDTKAEIALTIDSNGHRHKVEMSAPDEAAPYLDVTELLEDLREGGEVIDVVRGEMLAHLRDLCDSLGIDGLETKEA